MINSQIKELTQQNVESTNPTNRSNLNAFILYRSQNYFIIDTKQEITTIKSRLKIDRKSLVAQQQKSNIQLNANQQIASYSVFLGILPIFNQYFLVFAEYVKEAAKIENHIIYEIDGLRYVAAGNQKQIQKEQKWPDISNYLSFLNLNVMQSGFYFSFTYNLSISKYQYAKGFPTNFKFCWNAHLCNKIFHIDQRKWFIPLVQGYISSFNIKVKGMNFDYILISRRSWKKGGTRYNSRGIDINGNVANYCQTQQIIYYNNYCCSHVQIRGSVPAFWKQSGVTATLSFNEDKKLNEIAFKKHINKIQSIYTRIFCINLLSLNKSQESQLTIYYEQLIKQRNDQNLRYQYFDFHEACKNQKFQNANLLIHKLSEVNLAFKFYAQDITSNKVVQIQRGVMRTNCLDCLDRTNVIQSKLAGQILQQILTKLGVQIEQQIEQSSLLQGLDNFNTTSNLIINFREIWANNGDMISLHYTGTGSTHTNITRKGKRDLKGFVDHSFKSLSRFYQQNVQDNYKQQVIDLLIGEHTQTLNLSQFQKRMKEIQAKK